MRQQLQNITCLAGAESAEAAARQQAELLFAQLQQSLRGQLRSLLSFLAQYGSGVAAICHEAGSLTEHFWEKDSPKLLASAAASMADTAGHVPEASIRAQVGPC